MMPVRVRAAALTITVLALLGASCSSSGDTDSGSLPSVGTQAPNSPPGSFADTTLVAAGTIPPPSGDASACAGAPFDLAVRTGSGEERTVPERSSWALQVPGTPTWVFVTSDVDLPAGSVRSTLPDPAGQTLVVIRLTSRQAGLDSIPLAAGDRFEPAGSSTTPDGRPVVDVQVRTGPGQAPSTAPLTGSLTVDAITSEGVCLSVDLHRDAGAQAKGRIAARFLSVNQSVLTS
jgi:hypothetical protein